MLTYEQTREYLIQYFFTEINELTPPIYTEKAAKDYLHRFLSDEWVDTFWSNNDELFLTELIDEYNRRLTDGISIFFKFLDDYGRKLKGNLDDSCDNKYSLFQQSLILLTDTEFELLSARILNFIGCDLSYATPQSHDQGLDAFGFKSLLSYEVTSSFKNSLDTWILIQAKHYNKHAISSKEIREFVGSSNLAIHSIYSTDYDKYPSLKLKPYSPTALVIVTSSEVKRTVSTLAKNSGIILITSSELCSIFYNNCDEFCGPTCPTLEETVKILRKESQNVIAHIKT